MMRPCILFITIFLGFSKVHAQFVVEGAELAAAAGTQMVIVADGDITNNSSFDFTPLDLRLSLIGDFSEINGNWTFSQLNMNGGIASMNGNLTVTNAMVFNQGVLRVPDNFKLLFTGAGENVSYNEDAPAESYIDGIFFQRGTGRRIFPLGDGETALPFSFLDVRTESEIGVRGVASGSDIAIQSDVVEVDNTRHWSIISDDVAGIQSRVSVYTNGVVFSKEGSMVVVDADPIILNANYLGGDPESSENFLVSTENIALSLVAIGRTDEVDLKIHDLITPFDGSDGSISGNDAIFVKNLLVNNKVILMDRWGVRVKEWTNYRNNDPNEIAFFKTLTPGNYICVVECTSSDGKRTDRVSQMVTILKTN